MGGDKVTHTVNDESFQLARRRREEEFSPPIASPVILPLLPPPAPAPAPSVGIATTSALVFLATLSVSIAPTIYFSRRRSGTSCWNEDEDG